MPFALLTIGMLLIITGFQNTYKEFGAQVVSDFSGNNSFFYWFLSLMIIGSIGYNKTLQPFARAFMALIIIAILFSNKGFFSQLNIGVKSGDSTPSNPIGVDETLTTASNAASAASGVSSILKVGEAIAIDA